ncbi:MAG: hypothetical protein COT91_02830 [Candidatus Doudnabacteria bacterium CG10_big_fil_rev_8_21_14_0_10_41_10]|uniref:SHS2 domain-containing protein n=1 Tax=Candidatus Doudnabacteria bacterium CG10_big_fil_rev_8_21_14_0_10_41_10 TaxID=1974551 RepID=A0A2H0VDK6_9BACT|nr:MAG: hypothetical protein COT91_02830 [Candidatus Doudnabacteria bacterium CG10_big_fil_rev_8_21_14_0_10_41_10]
MKIKLPFTKKEKQSQKNTPALVFDFGTESVKVLLCNYVEDRVEILDGAKVKYNLGGINLDQNFLSQNLVEQLSGPVKSLIDKSKNPVKLAVIGIGGLTVEGYTSKINYRRVNENKEITETEFKEILKRVEERADQIMRKTIAWETAESEVVALISSEVLDISLGGYSMATPVGSNGEKLSFVVYNSYTKEKNLKTIVETVKNLGLQVVSVTVDSYAVMRVVVDSQGESVSAVVLDIGAKTTDVGIIDAGRILGHAGLDLAGSSFTQSIAEELHKEIPEAEAAKFAFASAKLDGDIMKEVRGAVASDCKVFVSGVELVLKEFPGLSGIPDKVYLVGGGSLLPGIIAGLQSSTWGESGEYESWLRADNLLPKDIEGFVDLTGQLNSSADVPILSVALDSIDLFTG